MSLFMLPLIRPQLMIYFKLAKGMVVNHAQGTCHYNVLQTRA